MKEEINKKTPKKRWWEEKNVTFKELAVCLFVSAVIGLAVIGANFYFLT